MVESPSACLKVLDQRAMTTIGSSNELFCVVGGILDCDQSHSASFLQEVRLEVYARGVIGLPIMVTMAQGRSLEDERLKS